MPKGLDTLESHAALRILTAAATIRVQSLWLVFLSLPAVDRAAMVASTTALSSDPDELFANLVVARRGQRLVGATWVQSVPGRTAIVWPPQLIEDEPEETATALLQEVELRLDGGDLDLAQAIQSSHRGAASDRLRRHGFQFAAKVLYLVCDVGGGGDVVPLANITAAGEEPQPLEFEPFKGSDATRLAGVIERTYIETMDIPVLSGVRRMKDVLDSYRNTGTYDPRNWFFVRSHGCDVGCLLLADHPDQDQFELVYMGVVPEARGKGLGKRLTAYAKRHTLHAGRRSLILAVDADNSPALLSYTSAGFQLCQEQYVFLRSYRK
jgi:ribosomal protein S18 acetylase RimI-like enzyme